MNQTNNKKLTGLSRALRNGMTPEERHLWYDFLKKLPVTIHRQKVIGPYIADFYCASAALVIELDGSQHRSATGVQADNIRDEYLNNLGILVLRYSNETIHTNFYGVCADIQRHIAARQSLHHQPQEP
jgi:very-short-patch-repair endonuclease